MDDNSVLVADLPLAGRHIPLDHHVDTRRHRKADERWDDALAETDSMPEDLKEDGAVCTELGIRAVISFHRGDVRGARRHLAAAALYDARLKPGSWPRSRWPAAGTTSTPERCRRP
jgi:hypothetical protein